MPDVVACPAPPPRFPPPADTHNAHAQAAQSPSQPDSQDCSFGRPKTTELPIATTLVYRHAGTPSHVCVLAAIPFTRFKIWHYPPAHLPTCPPVKPPPVSSAAGRLVSRYCVDYTKFKHARAAELRPGQWMCPRAWQQTSKRSRLGRQDATVPGLARPRRPPLLLLVYLPSYCRCCNNRPLIYPWPRLSMRLFGCWL